MTRTSHHPRDEDVRYVKTLDPRDLNAAERLAIELMASLFVEIERAGDCFDVLVAPAIELGEHRLAELTADDERETLDVLQRAPR